MAAAEAPEPVFHGSREPEPATTFRKLLQGAQHVDGGGSMNDILTGTASRTAATGLGGHALEIRGMMHEVGVKEYAATFPVRPMTIITEQTTSIALTDIVVQDHVFGLDCDVVVVPPPTLA